jgi:hypothetical protein
MFSLNVNKTAIFFTWARCNVDHAKHLGQLDLTISQDCISTLRHMNFSSSSKLYCYINPDRIVTNK